MTAYQPLCHADHQLTLKKVADNSWWVLRTDLYTFSRRSHQPRVVFFADTEAAARDWLNAREQPFFFHSLPA